NGQPGAFLATQSNFVFADELANVLEADRSLMHALATRFYYNIDHLHHNYTSNGRHFPLARFDQIVVDERENQIRLNPRAIAIHDSKAVSVAVGCQPGGCIRIDDRLS